MFGIGVTQLVDGEIQVIHAEGYEWQPDFTTIDNEISFAKDTKEGICDRPDWAR